jgi:hypothetical protein
MTRRRRNGPTQSKRPRERGRVVITRRWGSGAIALLVAAGLVAGCSGSSSGQHTSDSTPSTPTTSDSPPSTVTTPTPSPSWTPPNYGAAQPAVDAFLALIRGSDAAFMDPAHIPSSAFDSYAIGDARTLFDAALYDEKNAGRYYRGTPDIQRVRVVSINLKMIPKTVVLRSCPLRSPQSPSIEYNANGKPVPQPTRKVRPPYAKIATVEEFNGNWMVSNFKTDASKTCTP